MPREDLRAIKNRCEYLTFRSFYDGYPVSRRSVPEVATPDEALDAIRACLASAPNKALLLSGGMDSAVLAPFMPKGSAAYTVYFDKIEKNELGLAKSYCEKFGLEHIPLKIDADEYLESIDGLIIRKGMPLSPAEPVYHLAAKKAAMDGHEQVVTGGGADGKQGGFVGLRHDVEPSEMEQRWRKHYINPVNILRDSISVEYAFGDFLKDGKRIVDSREFLWYVGTERFAYDNAIEAAGTSHIAPFSTFRCAFDKWRNKREPKYFIVEMYRAIFGYDPPKKYGMQKPSYALGGYKPTNLEIFKEFDIKSYDFNKKVQIFFLERFEALRPSIATAAVETDSR